jgi:hypothetical protein
MRRALRGGTKETVSIQSLGGFSIQLFAGFGFLISSTYEIDPLSEGRALL